MSCPGLMDATVKNPAERRHRELSRRGVLRVNESLCASSPTWRLPGVTCGSQEEGSVDADACQLSITSSVIIPPIHCDRNVSLDGTRPR
ncbi:39S ribosomal protein L46, mitochondrial [Clarias magur]|uniref:39S ribosomal protein L46, mitochondrial n=1 Tax=Clarias magur TaxID=1594786 RepID=A0A8J4TMD3_CLAMG|nr:39S ribosomal protein L46, mitochondrial [Clarias magur]